MVRLPRDSAFVMIFEGVVYMATTCPAWCYFVDRSAAALEWVHGATAGRYRSISWGIFRERSLRYPGFVVSCMTVTASRSEGVKFRRSYLWVMGGDGNEAEAAGVHGLSPGLGWSVVGQAVCFAA